MQLRRPPAPTSRTPLVSTPQPCYSTPSPPPSPLPGRSAPMPPGPSNAGASTSTLPPTASTSTLPPISAPLPTPHPEELTPQREVVKGKGKARWWSVRQELENKGSVARDHLASERTYLAWLRTSLSLASIGIAITQLFRLTTFVDTPSTPSTPLAGLSLTSLSAEDYESLQGLLSSYARRLDALDRNDPQKYRHLGKPVGGTFIALALVFLFLGSYRYFRVQSALTMDPSQFPPARRSVIFSTFCIAGIVVAAFGTILATR